VECGCVLVKDGDGLRDTFSLVPPYIRTEPGKGIGGLPWYSEYGFQQSRGFRALKLWVTLQHAGKDGLSAMIRRHNILARQLEDLIREALDLELAAEGDLSVVCFRFHPRNWTGSPERLDELNKRIMETLQAEGSVFVTNTVLRSRFTLRACIIHYATSEADLAALVTAVRDAGSRILNEGVQ
jgi:aromatic-L-amino-acid decarboxylase